MKCILYMLCLLSVSMPAFSQISRGTSTIGGGVSASYRSTKYANHNKATQTTFTLRPDYGVFVIDNLCVGASLSGTLSRYNDSYSLNDQELNNVAKSLGIGPFVRYYLAFNNKLYGIAHAGYNIEWSRYESEFPYVEAELASTSSSYRTSTWGIGAGLAYFLTPHTALEGMLGYAGRRHKVTDPDENFIYPSSREKTGTFSLSVGLRIFLHKAS